MPLTPVTSEIIPAVPHPIPGGLKGAYAEETAESRIGLQSGMLGAQNVTRQWRVYTAKNSDNPIVTMEGLSSRYGGVVVGSPFPTTGGWGDGSFILSYFTIVDHGVGTRVWTLQGNYVPSYLTGLPGVGWSFAIQSSIETKKIYQTIERDVDGNPIGKGIGLPLYSLWSLVGSPPPVAFKVTSPLLGELDVFLPGGGTDPTDNKIPRFATGVDAPARVSTVIFSKTIRSFQTALPAIHAVLNAKRFVNSDDIVVRTTSGEISFFTNTPGKVLLAGVEIQEAQNQEQGLTPYFRVTIGLKYNPDGWQHKLVHAKKLDDGTLAPIRSVSTGKFIEETFQITGETSISGLLGAFLTV